MTSIDTNIFGGELASLIENHERLEKAAHEAAVERSAASAAVSDAEARDITDAATALRTGDEGDENALLTPSAVESRELADRNAQVCQMALRQNANSIVEEAATDAYAARLSKAEEAATKAALNHLAKLDAELLKVQQIRAHKKWLTAPMTASGLSLRPPFASDVFCRATSVAKQNGDAPQARELTDAVRQALGNEPVTTKNSYGIPAGMLAPAPDNLIGTGAARAFNEQLEELAR